MPLNTQDQVLAGMQWLRPFAKSATPTLVVGKPQSLWGLNGIPSAGTYNTTAAGVVLSSTSAQVTGQINYIDAVSSETKLARLQGQSNIAGTLVLADRLWHNGGFNTTLTTAQTVNSAIFPARDINGTTNGDGVLIGLEISAAAGAAAPLLTLSYTNSDGVAGRTATNYFPTANSPVAGSIFPFGLQSGDIGVRSIQSLTLSVSWVSGTINLVAYRILGMLELNGLHPNAIDAFSGGFSKFYNGSVPYLFFIPQSTAAANISGHVIWSQG